MDTDEPSRPGRGFLLALGLVALLGGALVAAELAVPLQPHLGGGKPVVEGGTVVMPLGVGSNLQLNFDPPVVTVILGFNATVDFMNSDTVRHTVTDTKASFDSGDILPNQKWTYTFTTPGNFSYYCIYHASWMKATVIVKGGQGPGGGSLTVRIPSGAGSNTNVNFSPSDVTLVVGINNTVLFVNEDTSPHTVTATDGSFDSQNIAPGQSWSHTFPAGTHSYYCIYHASWMKGTITVKIG